MTILCPTMILPASLGFLSGVSITGIAFRWRRRTIGSAPPPPASKQCRAVELMLDAAQTAFGRKPFRMRDLWPLIGTELKAMGINSKLASHYIWHEAKNGGRFLHTEDHGYYVVTAEVVLALDHIKPNAIILNRKISNRLLGPLVAVTLMALSGWWLKPVHLTDLVNHIHHLSG